MLNILSEFVIGVVLFVIFFVILVPSWFVYVDLYGKVFVVMCFCIIYGVIVSIIKFVLTETIDTRKFYPSDREDMEGDDIYFAVYLDYQIVNGNKISVWREVEIEVTDWGSFNDNFIIGGFTKIDGKMKYVRVENRE